MTQITSGLALVLSLLAVLGVFYTMTVKLTTLTLQNGVMWAVYLADTQAAMQRRGVLKHQSDFQLTGEYQRWVWAKRDPEVVKAFQHVIDNSNSKTTDAEIIAHLVKDLGMERIAERAQRFGATPGEYLAGALVSIRRAIKDGVPLETMIEKDLRSAEPKKE